MKEESDSRSYSPARTSLFPVETLALIALFSVFVLYALFGIEARLVHPERNLLTYYLELLRSLLFLYPLTLLFAFLATLVQNGNNRHVDVTTVFRKRFLTGKLVVEHLRLLHGAALCLLMFAHLKHLIPYVNSDLYDAPLLWIDQQLFGDALLPGMFDREFNSALTRPLELVYQGFYPYLSIVLCLFVVLPARTLAREFCTFYGLLWLIGILVVYLMPTWGPCFFTPHYFSTLPENSMRALQESLWNAKSVIEIDPLNPHFVFAISGLPSLHFALTLGGTYYLWKVWSPLGYISGIFALLTFASTLFFGWHYLLDDIGSVGLVVLCIWLSQRIHRSN